MRRAIPVAVAAAALCVSQLPAASPTAAGAPDSAPGSVAKPGPKVRTPFALAAAAFGTAARGGQVPANSGGTAYRQISCTNVAGTVRRNVEAEVTIPGLGVAEGVSTRVWTAKRGGTVSSHATHDIARVTIADTPLGRLQLRGLSSRSEAFHADGRFGTRVATEVARIVFRPAGGGEAQTLPVPTPGRPLVVPGVARIEIGKSQRRATSAGARATARVLDVTVLPTGTRVRVAQSTASITSGVRRGVFRGFSAGIEARGLDDNVRSGRTPVIFMPCQGTGGRTQSRNIADADLGGQVVARALATRQVSTNRRNLARGTEIGQVGRVALAEGRVVIDAVRGQVNVRRGAKGVTRNIRGTRVGSIIVDGDRYALPAVGPLEIPGLVRIEDRVTTRTRNGIRVVALRVSLLDGTGAVVDLGVAKLAIGRGAPRR